jgi:RND family efflux transporter MFP subunit
MQKQGIEYQSGVGKVPVFAGLLNETGYPHKGVLDFVDSVSSASTGTIQLRGSFSNEDTLIFPGVFVRVRIPLGEPQTLPVIPGRAIGNDQQGDYVLLVDAENTVARQSIVRGQKTDEGYAIENGLTATDRVIVNGSIHARPGDKVTPVTDPGGDTSTPPAATSANS